MKPESNRQKKFNRLIQRELSELFQRDLIPPAGSMVTVSTVRCSTDLQHVKVYISVFPDAKGPEVLRWAEERNWEIRKVLAGKIRKVVRFVPELAFFEDDSLQVAEEMDKLFDSLKSEEE